MFKLVCSCCICSLCCMTSSVKMVALHFNLNCNCNKLFLCLVLNPINIQKTTKLNPNTPWMECNKIIINIAYYCFLLSMNHSRFMKIQNIYQFFCSTCFIKLLILIFDIPCRLQLSCIYITGGLHPL
jgi:hypothetical protein